VDPHLTYTPPTGRDLGSLPLLLVELQRDRLSVGDRRLIDVANIVVLVAFAVDYLVELILTNDRRQYIRAEWINAIIVASAALAVAPTLSAVGGVRVLRALPVLRGVLAVVRLLAASGMAARDGRRLVRRRALSFAVGTASLTWLSAAAAFTLAEDVGDGRRVESFLDALWWSAATITTVGYGDITPVTSTGRAVGVVAMVVGISTFAIVTARVAAFLVADDG